MTEFDGTPKGETEHRDEISHHQEWQGLQMKESNREHLRGETLIELRRISHISLGLHP